MGADRPRRGAQEAGQRLTVTDPRQISAVVNNARWCDTVCRSHGVGTAWLPQCWRAAGDVPPGYPQVVTLTPGAEAAVTAGAASVKDSFAALDLTPAGLEPLFEARWLFADAAELRTAGRRHFSLVGSAAELGDWAAAHGCGDVLRPALLADPAVRVFAQRDGERIVAGGIANRSGSVVGVSNVFGDVEWPQLLGAVSRAFPGLAVVGYERGETLAGAIGAGFTVLGQLRVWQRP